jgi:ankyrin repeat protein
MLVALLVVSGCQKRQAGSSAARDALLAAVQAGDVEAARRALGDGAEANARDERGVPALCNAAIARSASLATLLLDSGARPDERTRYGRATALMVAVHANRADVVATLLQHGASVGAQASNGATALMIAAQDRRADLVGLLLRAGAKPDQHPPGGWPPICCAAYARGAEAVRALLDGGAAADAGGPEGVTALQLAAERDDLETARVLLDRGANPSLKGGSGQYAALHHAAASKGSPGMVRLLLERGADRNPRARYGVTPLLVATQRGKQGADVVRVLLEAGADPNLDEESYHWSPLHFAARDGNAEVVRLLLQHGANVNAMNSDRETPLALAEHTGGWPEVKRLLRAAGGRVAEAQAQETP